MLVLNYMFVTLSVVISEKCYFTVPLYYSNAFPYHAFNNHNNVQYILVMYMCIMPCPHFKQSKWTKHRQFSIFFVCNGFTCYLTMEM